MNEGYKKERFATIKIKDSVANKFRKFCKEIKPSVRQTTPIPQTTLRRI
jgi:hypothetical protein